MRGNGREGATSLDSLDPPAPLFLFPGEPGNDPSSPPEETKARERELECCARTVQSLSRQPFLSDVLPFWS